MASPLPPPAATTTTVKAPVFISTTTLNSILTHKTLISHLQSTLPSAAVCVTTPLRHNHVTSASSSLLLMPSWSTSPSLPYIGVKLVNYNPLNSQTLALPGVHATYVLSSSLSGQTLALLDATDMTLFRTAAISALASLYLSRPDSQVLVMVGAGNLAPHLIRAHITARPSLNRVLIWNRRAQKAVDVAEKLKGEIGIEGLEIERVGQLQDAVGLGDIISCATNSEAALVAGAWLKDGAHLDLVGSFKETMKECDDEAIKRARVFVDNEAALEEAGELVGAFERGVITREEIAGSLVELINGEKLWRMNSEEITVFKSVGSGVVDMLTAQLVYETCVNKGLNQGIDA